MTTMTGAELTAHWRTRMGQSIQRMKDGANNTSKSQTKNAIAAKALMVENHRKAIEAGKWEKGLEKAGDEKWRRNFVDKGVGKVTAGIDANIAEIELKMAKVAEVGEAVKTLVATMPKGTLQDSMDRVLASMTLQKERWGKPLV